MLYYMFSDTVFNNLETMKDVISSTENSTTISASNEAETASVRLRAGSTQVSTAISSTTAADMHPTRTKSYTTHMNENNENDTTEALVCNCNASRYYVLDEEKLEKIISELKIDVKNISSSRRKLTSAPDSRPSAIGVGLFGTILLVTIFSAIVCPDVWSLINNVLIVRIRPISQA